MLLRRAALASLVAMLTALPGSAAGDWLQWGGGPAHRSAASVPALPLAPGAGDVVCDPFVSAEIAETGGDLLVHYAVPLLDGADVYMTFKSGQYISCDPPGSGNPAPCGPAAWNAQSWGVRKLRWHDGALEPVWKYTSDWKPVPQDIAAWEPVFQPVLSGGFLYVPAAGGAIDRVSPATGSAVARVRPISADPNAYVCGGLAADDSGNVWYDVMALDPSSPIGDAGGWLVRVGPDGAPAAATFASLVPGAPAPTSACEISFRPQDLPWPPSPAAVPPTAFCGSQRPAVNVIPAIGADGTVYTVSRANNNGRYAYLVAVHPDLTAAWAESLRGRLKDGCDVLLPASGTPGGCRAGAAAGVDPATNGPPAGQVLDSSTASPVVLPDGTVLFGAYTRYNGARGHLFHFDAAGRFLGSYDFGWDVTPAVAQRGSSYSVLLKDNHYGVGSYCGNPSACPSGPERYDLVSLDPDLRLQWRFTSTNTLSCQRGSDGTVSCVSDHPNGFEWCINQPAVDSRGVLYANSEDGFLYAITSGGELRESLFLDRALGAAYTPIAIGSDGFVYAQNAGRLFGIGNAAREAIASHPPHGPARRVAPR